MGFSTDTFSGQERLGWQIQNAERKELPLKSSIPGEAALQKQRRKKDFPEQTDAEGVRYHQTCLTRNAEENSLSGNKRMLITIIKKQQGSRNITGNVWPYTL